MDPITQQAVLAAAGAGGDKVYVDDVFSTTLYTGNNNSPSQVVNTGIDNTEKSMVWIKSRTTTFGHNLFDTVRGTGYRLSSNNSDGQVSDSSGVTAFNSNGITIGGSNYINGQNADIVAWNFKAAPGFFDVVTYTGDGVTNRAVPHSLGSVPGMIIVKQTNTSGQDWHVWHRSMNPAWTGGTTAGDTTGGNNVGWIGLNLYNAYSGTRSAFTYVNDTAFGVYRSNLELNASGSTYVAYIFAHDDAQFGTDGDESIIKCGTYTGTNAENIINVGFEPQYFFIKRTDSAGLWMCWDVMRGAANNSTNQPSLYFTSSDAESPFGQAYVHQNGFAFSNSDTDFNASGGTYIYMAIRRPNKPPEAGTEVFAIDTRSGTSPTPPTYKSGFPVDWVWERRSDQTNNWSARTRLIGEGKEFDLNTTGAESSNTTDRITFDRNDGVGTENSVVSTQYAWMFKRTPGFFDVVAYTGTGSPHTINHNLTVPPELMIVKSRSYADAWHVYSSALGNTKYISLNTTTKGNTLAVWNNTTPTSSVFSVGSRGETNTSSATYINYLFATLPGISKVGSYSGSSSAQNIDCGFTNGARFVLIKRTDSSGHWMVFDTSRGIISGSDPGLRLDLPNPQSDTTFDYIDPYSAGFTIRSFGDVNTSGGTYIFLAIA